MKLSALFNDKQENAQAISSKDQKHDFDAIDVVGLTANSREVKMGYVFAALKGVGVDGAKYIPQAIENGAVAILTHKDADLSNFDIPFLAVEDPRNALAYMSATFFERQPSTIVAVTGTAGKTSIASFVRQIWASCDMQAASIGTTGVVSPTRNDYGSLTTPDPVSLHKLLAELQDEGVTHASMEASSHGLDQHRLDGVKLAAGAFINLGRDHMDYHPTVEHYFESKMRLFKELLAKGAPAIICADDEWSDKCIQIAKDAGLKVLTTGQNGTYLSLKRLEHERFNQVAEITHEDKIYRVKFPLAGDFQMQNALVACGLAIATGAEPKAAINALQTLQGAPGRLELVGYSKDKAPCYVDYAHKPEALEHVILSLRPFTTGKVYCVFGCGGDRDAGKREIMGEIAQRLADVVVVTDDNPRTENAGAIRAQVMKGAPTALEIGDREEAIFHCISNLQEGDCLVVAGKGHEPGQIVGDKVLAFSDHEVVRRALSEHGGKPYGEGA
ncbi:MAG: UDP-N-acetylmuramoyl-L-alanyl-D-glutamate--2,6-diaminopimelate ligase [Nitratireductor sp.]